MMQIFTSEAKALQHRNELAKRNPNTCFSVLHRYFGTEARYIVGKWVNRGSKRVFIAQP